MLMEKEASAVQPSEDTPQPLTPPKEPFRARHPRIWFLLTHFAWGCRLILGAAAMVPVLVFMVWFNYTVDCSGLFHGDVYTREIATMLLDGKNVDHYDSMDERALNALVVEQMDSVPATVAFGSSRVMQMTRRVAGITDFYNFGMTGGDFYDLLGMFELFENKGQLPENVILCIDPWVLNGSGSADTTRSDRNLYNEFLAKRLGEDVTYTQQDPTVLRRALVSPSYFQGNWKYWLKDRRHQAMPQAVSGDAYENSATEIKNCDGSMQYAISLRYQTTDQQIQNVMSMIGTAPTVWFGDYDGPDATRTALLIRYIRYMKSRGVQVYFLLPPLHPLMYEYTLTYPDEFLGFLRTEDAVRAIAAETDTPVYGSYDPHLISGVTAADFYDGVHCTSECLEKFWPGISAARANEQAGIDPADSLPMTLDDELYMQFALRCGPVRARELKKTLGLTLTQSAETLEAMAREMA